MTSAEVGAVDGPLEEEGGVNTSVPREVEEEGAVDCTISVEVDVGGPINGAPVGLRSRIT
jgi:hypothetical protein